jgi:hypothetical protein
VKWVSRALLSLTAVAIAAALLWAAIIFAARHLV